MNRYIKAMKIGLDNEETGISYFDLFYSVKGTKEKVSSNEAEISFFMWFLQNFHNTEDRHYPDANLIREYRVWLIKEEQDKKYHDFNWLSVQDKNYLNSKWFLNGQAAKQYLDYVELTDARKQAKITSWFSIVSILIAVAAILIGVFSRNDSPNPPYDVKIIEDRTKVKELQNENDQLKEELYKAEMLIKTYESDSLKAG